MQVNKLKPYIVAGYLQKQGWIRSSKWQPRYFVLTGNAVYYFKRGPNDELFGESRGRIPIETITVYSAREGPEYFILHSKKTHTLRAASPQEAGSWKRAIEEAKVAYIASHGTRGKARKKKAPKNAGAPISPGLLTSDSSGETLHSIDTASSCTLSFPSNTSLKQYLDSKGSLSSLTVASNSSSDSVPSPIAHSGARNKVGPKTLVSKDDEDPRILQVSTVGSDSLERVISRQFGWDHECEIPHLNDASDIVLYLSFRDHMSRTASGLAKIPWQPKAAARGQAVVKVEPLPDDSYVDSNTAASTSPTESKEEQHPRVNLGYVEVSWRVKDEEDEEGSGSKNPAMMFFSTLIRRSNMLMIIGGLLLPLFFLLGSCLLIQGDYLSLSEGSSSTFVHLVYTVGCMLAAHTLFQTFNGTRRTLMSRGSHIFVFSFTSPAENTREHHKRPLHSLTDDEDAEDVDSDGGNGNGGSIGGGIGGGAASNLPATTSGSLSSVTANPVDDEDDDGYSTDHDDDDDDGAEESKSKKGTSEDLPLFPAVWGKWGPPDAKALFVRGSHYMRDQKKVQVEETMFELLHCDVIATHTRVDHEAQRPESWINSPARLNDKDKPLMFIINFQVPGSPSVHVVLFFKRRPPKSPPDPNEAGFEILLDRFLNGSDEFRDTRLKFIPHVIEGNWLVRKGVGTKPAIIGKKLKQKYYQSKEQNYFEVDVDVGSSAVGGSIFKLVKGYCITLTIDLCFTLEGQSEEELPERLVGGVRMAHCDMSKLRTIDHIEQE